MLLLSVFVSLLFHTLPILSTAPICTDGFQALNTEKCVRFFNQTQYSTHGNSVRQCKSFGAYPVAVHNAIDNNYITSLASSAGSQGVWLGITCFGNDPSVCFWDDQSGNASSWSQFSAGHPNTDIGECVVIQTSGSQAGRWKSADCADRNDYICQMPSTYPDDTCDFLFDNYCYYISSDDDTPVNYVDAELDCQSRGSHLASFHSFTEFEYLRQGIINMPIAIGARQTADNRFEWIDGSPWDYERPVLRNETDGGCVYIRGWNEPFYDTLETTPCSSADNRYVCKRAVRSQLAVTPSPSNPSGCNATLILAPGVITSPNYPNLYPNNVKCNYLIRSSNGLRIGIMFTDVVTEKDHDWITLRNGTDENSLVIERISGEIRNEMFYSRSNSLFVTFESDGANVGFGFRAQLDVYVEA